MPNWNYNNIEISGHQVPELMKKAKAEDSIFSMENFYPTPKEETDAYMDEPRMGWLPWRSENWGTKWDMSEVQLIDQMTEDYINFGYLTPWGPNIAFLDKLSADYPELWIKLNYCEEGNYFCGRIEWHNGEQQQYDYYSLSEEDGGMKEYANRLFELGFESEADFVIEQWEEEKLEEAEEKLEEVKMSECAA